MVKTTNALKKHIMNKNKSISSYTNKWLRRNSNLWVEDTYRGASDLIVIYLSRYAPKIVVKRVQQINTSRIKHVLNKEYKIPPLFIKINNINL